MGRYLKQYEKESMRMAILKQEETFRHQVHELHRLYRVQKVLIDDMKQRKSSNSWNVDDETASQQPCYSSSPALNLDLPAEEYIGKDWEESDLELTLATGSKSGRRKDNSSATSDSGASFSSSSSGYSGAKMKLNGSEWPVGTREERVKSQPPPWLLHCLGLNMT